MNIRNKNNKTNVSIKENTTISNQYWVSLLTWNFGISRKKAGLQEKCFGSKVIIAASGHLFILKSAPLVGVAGETVKS